MNGAGRAARPASAPAIRELLGFALLELRSAVRLRPAIRLSTALPGWLKIPR